MRSETSEEFQARMEQKAARQRWFADLEIRARESQSALSTTTVKPKPKAPVAPKPAKVVRPKAASTPRASVGTPPGPCNRCGREMRRQSDPGGGRGGKPRVAAKGLCAACYRLAHREAAGLPTFVPRPTHCTSCGRKMRGARQEGDSPGTVRHAGRGLCTTCRGRAQGAPPRFVRPEACVDCGTRLHPSAGAVAGSWRGTVESKPHAGKGRCSGCAAKARRRGQASIA